MNLHAHLFSLTAAERESLASACDTSVGHLNNVAYGKSCSAILASLIERATGGAVMRWDMRPGDWWRIWPELIDRPDAPAVLAEEMK